MIIAAAVLALCAGGVEDLAWMAGAWVHEKDGATVRETWLAPIDGVMAGAGQTNRPGRKPFVEHMQITAEPGGPTFTAIVGRQPPVAFVLKPGDGDTFVFENLAHDFPQRVIYRRCGEDLCARTEGMVDGQLQGEEWRYRRVP